jgi:RNA polymerase sigma-70 factor (ECF subfamily)
LAQQNGFQHADAQDLTQEVFAAVGKAIDRFDPGPEKGSFRGWLYRVARNLMINFLTRKKGPRGTGDTAIQQLLNQQPAADEEATTLFEMEYQREVFRWAAQRVRQDFQEETWRAFWMTGVEGESIEDVARILGKTPGAIRIARCRILACLKEEVTRFEGTLPE